MKTRLIFGDSAKNLDHARKQLKNKYKSTEELFAEVQKYHCNAPELVDDYMLWQVLQAQEKQLQYLDNSIVPPQAAINFKHEIVYHTADFYQVLTPRRMELLEYISNKNPKSVKSLAAELQRDYKNVYDDLLALQRYQLIDFIREGKNKRPVARLTGIEVVFD
ncbi:HVO_A0114 family putative DNA-binding protein [[Eubacterium] cellulosolvens]